MDENFAMPTFDSISSFLIVMGAEVRTRGSLKPTSFAKLVKSLILERVKESGNNYNGLPLSANSTSVVSTTSSFQKFPKI